MNKILEAYARQWLKDSLATLNDRNRHVFMLMYSHLQPTRPIEEAIDAMAADKLDWAMVQVKRTIDNQRSS